MTRVEFGYFELCLICGQLHESKQVKFLALIRMKIKPLWVLNAILGFVLGSSLAVSVIFLPSQFLKIPHIYRVLYTLILIVFFCSSAGFVLSRSITPKFLIFALRSDCFC